MKRHLVKGDNFKKDVYFWSIPKNGCSFLFRQGFSKCEKFFKKSQENAAQKVCFGSKFTPLCILLRSWNKCDWPHAQLVVRL